MDNARGIEASSSGSWVVFQYLLLLIPSCQLCFCEVEKKGGAGRLCSRGPGPHPLPFYPYKGIQTLALIASGTPLKVYCIKGERLLRLNTVSLMRPHRTKLPLCRTDSP